MFSMGDLHLPSALLPVFAVLLLHASAQTIIKCPRSSPSLQTVTNYNGVLFKMDLTLTGSTVLQPNMDCAFVVVGKATSRWVITMDTVSLGAYQAQFVIQDSGSGGRQILAVDSNGTSYRQVVTTFGSFYVRLTTKTTPTASALGVKLTIEHLGPRDCPSGWYSPAANTEYCYGVPKLVANLTYNDSITGCNMMLANLAMGDSDYNSIASDLLAAPLSTLDSRQSYWVGLYVYDNDGEVRYLNKYRTLDTITGRLCSLSSRCNCVAYQSGKFYRDDCRSRRPYVCYMPRGGTTTYHNLSSNAIMATATPQTVIIHYSPTDHASYTAIIVPIVLTAVVLLIAIASTILALVCCLKRRAAYRRNLQQSHVEAVAVVAATGETPPPYQTVLMATAPQPVGTYSNLAFDASGGGGIGINEKPPAYSAEWAPST